MFKVLAIHRLWSRLSGNPSVFSTITEIDIDSAESTEMHFGSVATTICYVIGSH